MIKFTKTELRSQQVRLAQLQKYLPTLQLKKMLLQLEVNLALAEIEKFENLFRLQQSAIEKFCSLFSDKNAFDLFSSVKVQEVQTKEENIAGIDVPIFEKVIYHENRAFLFDAPVWLDAATAKLRELIAFREQITVSNKKKKALEKELRDVSIRVNLFEKILIPRAQSNISKIKVFLGDMQLAAVCQAKVSKQKILKRERV